MLRQLELRSHGDNTAEGHSKPCQIWKMLLFAKTANGFHLLTVFPKSSMLDV